MSGSKKRGLSADEKKLKLKEIFIETKEVLTLKELEKIAPKSKGINAMIVKDVLQQLVDDNLVLQDKIGISNYFWSFPSQEIHLRKVKIDALSKELETAKRKRDSNREQIKQLSVGREVSEDRQSKLQKLTGLQNRNAQLKTELQEYAENDPDYLKLLKDQTTVSLESANRWTDSVFSVRQYVCDKFSSPQDQFDGNFGIDEKFDYIS